MSVYIIYAYTDGLIYYRRMYMIHHILGLRRRVTLSCRITFKITSKVVVVVLLMTARIGIGDLLRCLVSDC